MTKYKENCLFFPSPSFFIFVPLSYSVFPSSCSLFLYFNFYISPYSPSFFFFAASLLSLNLPFLKAFPFVFSLLLYITSFTLSAPFPLSTHISSLLLFCGPFVHPWAPDCQSTEVRAGCLSVHSLTQPTDQHNTAGSIKLLKTFCSLSLKS